MGNTRQIGQIHAPDLIQRKFIHYMYVDEVYATSENSGSDK